MPHGGQGFEEFVFVDNTDGISCLVQSIKVIVQFILYPTVIMIHPHICTRPYAVLDTENAGDLENPTLQMHGGLVDTQTNHISQNQLS